MTAETPARRKRTARELAEQYGVSERTIRNIVAEPREEYISRAASRGEQIKRLHETGLSMRAIAAEVGCGVGTVHRWVKRLEATQPTN